METKLTSLNLSDTQKIDLLLKKVNSVEQIVQNRHKYTIKYPNFKIKKYKQSRIWTDGMIQVYDCINNTYNQFDHELAKKVSITIYWYKRTFAGKLGLYYLGSRAIKLNIGWEEFYKTSETFYHELGHAWYYQLPYKLKKMNEHKISRLAWKTIQIYLTLETKMIFSSFSQARNTIRKNIRHYAGKNIVECFAELFAKSCSEAFELRKQGKDPLKHSNAFQAINYFNSFLKN